MSPALDIGGSKSALYGVAGWRDECIFAHAYTNVGRDLEIGSIKDGDTLMQLPSRILKTVVFSLFGHGLATLALAAEDPAAAPHWPGVQADGRTLLPNQWTLEPAGKQIPLGDFPVHIALHPSGAWAAVLVAAMAPTKS